MDARLREIERRAVASGEDSDMLSWARELDRAGAFDKRLEMLPSVQVRFMDALGEQASSGKRDDVLLYMKALNSLGYPVGTRDTHDVVHDNDLCSAIACALMDRGMDEEAVWMVMSASEHLWENTLGPMLDELEEACDEAMTVIRQRTPRPLPLRARRNLAANEAYAQIRQDGYWSSVNIDDEQPWRRSENVWRRDVFVGDGMGWTDRVIVTVTFAQQSAEVLGVTAIGDNDNESVLFGQE